MHAAQKKELTAVATGSVAMKRRKRSTAQHTHQHALVDTSDEENLAEGSEAECVIHMESEEEVAIKSTSQDGAKPTDYKGTKGRTQSKATDKNLKLKQQGKGSSENSKLNTDDITRDQNTCMEEFEAVMEKLLEASKEQKFAEDASAATMSAVDRRSIETDRIARMELKHATQKLQDLRKQISSLTTERCAHA